MAAGASAAAAGLTLAVVGPSVAAGSPTRTGVASAARTDIASAAGTGVSSAAQASLASLATSTTAALSTAPGRAGAYSFLAKVGKKPVRWNPCHRIRYRANLAEAPHHALRQVKKALRRVHHGSGLRFHYLGKTRVKPNPSGRHYPGRTELVVGWLRPSQTRYLTKGVAGQGGGQWIIYRYHGHRVGQIRTGFAVLNAKLNGRLANGFGAGHRYGEQGTEGQLLMHELGHVVGLGHVQNKPQIMYPMLTHKIARWGAGDLNGLERVGRSQGCLPGPSATTTVTPQVGVGR